ncbi:MAG: Rieske 2Fe-2S domain-containing protein [Bacteroidota bacterium]
MEAVLNRKRREFLSTVTHGGVCLLCSAGIVSLLTGCKEEDNPVSFDEPVIDINKETALQSVGGAVKKRISSVNGGNVIIVVRTGDASFIALSAICTHQGSEVGLPEKNVITCPNHGSRFNATNGSVVNGPATSPLPTFTATYDANKNTVTIG